MRWMTTTGLENIVLAKLSADGLLAKMKHLNKIDKKNIWWINFMLLLWFYDISLDGQWKKNEWNAKPRLLILRGKIVFAFLYDPKLKRKYAFSVRIVFSYVYIIHKSFLALFSVELFKAEKLTFQLRLHIGPVHLKVN